MSIWRIDYTYECWKCPDRHAGSYTVDADSAQMADLKWRGDMVADFHGGHDYKLQVTEMREETK